MSLIICKNNPDEDVNVGEEDNINKPYSFRNAMTSNVTIPKNAQVALQSVKVNMDGLIVVGDERKIFYNYYGPEIIPTGTAMPSLQDSPNYPMKIPIFQGSVKKSVGVGELSDDIQTSVNNMLSEPSLKNRFTAVVKSSGVGAFEGFSFTFDEDITGAKAGFGPQNVIPPANVPGQQTGVLENRDTSKRLYQLTNNTDPGSEEPQWSYNVGVFNTATTANPNGNIAFRTRSIIGNVPPLHSKGGIYKVDFSGCLNAGGGAAPVGDPDGYAKFIIGLSRGSRAITYNAAGEVVRVRNARIKPPYYAFGNGSYSNSWMSSFNDYGIAYDWTNSSNAGLAGLNVQDRLVVFHTVMNRTDLRGAAGRRPENLRLIKQQRFQYGDGTGVGGVDTGTDPLIVASAGFDPVTGYNLTTNPLGLDEVKFKLEGQQVTIIVRNSGTATDYNLVTYDATRGKARNLKCVNQSCQALLPTLQINNRFAASPLQQLEITQFDGCSGNFSNYNFLSDDDSKNDFFNKAYSADPSQTIITRDLDERPFNDYGVTPATPVTFTYPGLTAGDYTFREHILCVKPGNVYGGQLNIATRGANTSNYLGFPSVSSVKLANGTIDSFSPPVLTSSKSIFVRLENFGQESINSYQGLRSKIIAHLPRFDGVNSVGPLYLEPNNMIYLDLKNSAPLKINSFDISLCYADETLAESLVGTTIVVLHIREKS